MGIFPLYISHNRYQYNAKASVFAMSLFAILLGVIELV